MSTQFENFLSFKERQSFSFQHEGIHLIDGYDLDAENNNAEFSLENFNVGVGKTTLAMVMRFAFYGEIQKRVNKDKIINKESKKNLFVQLDFYVSKELYRIERYRKHDDYGNSIFLLKSIKGKWENISGIDIKQTQEMISSLIVLDVKAYDKSVLFTRDDRNQFLELNTTERALIFENISQINKLKEYLEKSKKRNKETIEGIESLDKDIIKIATIIKKDKEYIETLKKDEINKKEKIQEEIESLKNEIKKIAEIDRPLDDFIRDIKLYKEYLNIIDETSNNNVEVLAKLKRLQHEIPKCKERLITIKEKIKTEKETLKNTKPKKCHNCGTEQDIEDHKTRIDNIKSNIDWLSSEKDSLIKEIETKESDLLTQQKKHSEYNATKEQTEKLLKELNISDDYFLIDINGISFLNDRLHAKEKDLENISNKDQISNLQKEIKKSIKELKEYRTRKEDLFIRKRVFDFWINILDFKNENSIKQFIISKIVPVFNMFVQQMVDAVYRGSLIISFDNFFNETIIRDGDEYDYEELSTGQKMKLNFCINLAIFDLTKVNLDGCNVIFMDEIFNNVDPPTIAVFLDIIKERYAKENAVYLISHLNEIKDNVAFDSRTLIEFKDKKSKIIS